MAQPALVPENVPRPEPDSIILLHGATWADYQRLLELRGDKSLPRVAYLEGVLELMSPSLSHEVIKSMPGMPGGSLLPGKRRRHHALRLVDARKQGDQPRR